ncbi:SAM-dependent methyltransferase [Sediminitomix flava]|uniref:16S rRNA (Cytidine1402-2'-O)-methyltransferase n=1 Tax=Sediminitomix flava TaxID=379075 RepID=A0A315ZAY5_SEDFL|nr:SAM-dependent methyltransferase [Sediminitomix flava]PWJ42711.1 16S rRNA (cytidine1402-2'-O)-methyltransferase [Sediminitomix flava]
MKVFLIPTTLAEQTTHYIPPIVTQSVQTTTYYFVENVRTARRFIGSLKLGIDIPSLKFYVVDKDTSKQKVLSYFKEVPQGENIGIISEAGCPGIADPGAVAVECAHEKNIEVVPLPGPSSIFMALMASGMNGQNFTFKGYLPIAKHERTKAIKDMEINSLKQNCSQIFMETPYRNNKLLQDLLALCKPNVRLCIAADITSKDEFIKTKTIGEWKKQLPDLHKRPTIFVLMA